MSDTVVPFRAEPRPSMGDLAAAKVRELFDKYAEDDYMTARLHGMVCNQLPQLMAGASRAHAERKLRIDGMTDEQTAFVQLFLANNRYFYCERTDKFFYYDLDRYVLYGEDDILHLVLSTISRSQTALVAWKRRTRTAVMQRIKRNNVLESVPESDTIQRVMDALYPALFPSRADAKYFLTVVGDNMRGERRLVHFVDARAKAFVRELSQACAALFGVGAHHSFKHKYHPEHEYASCRIVRINACASLPANWRFLAKGDRGLELFVVAAHYSARYGGSDGFLADALEGEAVAPVAGFLREHSPDSIVAAFAAECLEFGDPAPGAAGLSWKSAQYLWQQFLAAKHAPCVMFMQPLKDRLVALTRDAYAADADTFRGVFSRLLPDVSAFMAFWRDQMCADEAERDLEIDEVAALFRLHGGSRAMSGETVAGILAHYLPEVDVEDARRVQGVRCAMWDKRGDIDAALAALRPALLAREAENPPRDSPVQWTNPYATTLYDMYVFYCARYAAPKRGARARPLVANKRYFDSYVSRALGDLVVDFEFVRREWLEEGA